MTNDKFTQLCTSTWLYDKFTQLCASTWLYDKFTQLCTSTWLYDKFTQLCTSKSSWYEYLVVVGLRLSHDGDTYYYVCTLES